MEQQRAREQTAKASASALARAGRAAGAVLEMCAIDPGPDAKRQRGTRHGGRVIPTTWTCSAIAEFRTALTPARPATLKLDEA